MDKKQAQPTSFEQENSVTTIVQEDKMNAINDNLILSQEKVWDTRREWVKPEILPALNLTRDQIMAATPVPFLEELFATGRIRLTQTANQTREQGIPVIFDNAIQIKQMFKALALVQFGIHAAWTAIRSSGNREIYLLDPTGDFSRWVTETSDGQHVKYDVFYASIKYNNMGNETISRGAVNPMQNNLFEQVNGYNAWVDAHNAAVMAYVTGTTTPEQMELLKGSDFSQTDLNRFAQYNTRSHVNYVDVVNKYVIEAWLLLDETKPAFEIWTAAKTWEAAVKRLERKLELGTKAYRNELAYLSQVNIWDEQEAE